MEILKVSWNGWKIRNTQRYVEGMYDLKYSWLDGEGMQGQKCSRLGGRYERSVILMVRWKVRKNKNTQG